MEKQQQLDVIYSAVLNYKHWSHKSNCESLLKTFFFLMVKVQKVAKHEECLVSSVKYHNSLQNYRYDWNLDLSMTTPRMKS